MSKQSCGYLFNEAGFVKSGGMWGYSQWKRLGPEMICAMGGGRKKNSNDMNDDFLQSPEKENYPVKVWIYQGFSCTYWSEHDGEAPDATDDCVAYVIFSNVKEALAFVHRLWIKRQSIA